MADHEYESVRQMQRQHEPVTIRRFLRRLNGRSTCGRVKGTQYLRQDDRRVELRPRRLVAAGVISRHRVPLGEHGVRWRAGGDYNQRIGSPEGGWLCDP